MQGLAGSGLLSTGLRAPREDGREVSSAPALLIKGSWCGKTGR